MEAIGNIRRESEETEFVFRPHRIILTGAERVAVTAVLELVDDGSDEGLPAHPAAPIAFPSAQGLTPNPRNAVAHAGFLEATSANPGHCLFHSSRALSVVEGAN